jgi:hypothetical protein
MTKLIITSEKKRFKLRNDIEGFRKNQVVNVHRGDDTDFTEMFVITSLNGKKTNTAYEFELAEIHAYDTKYVRKEYVEQELKIGDSYTHTYSNGTGRVKVGGFDETNKVLVDEPKEGISRNIKDYFGVAYTSFNEIKKEAFDKAEDRREIANNILFEMEFGKCEGGELRGQILVEFMQYIRKLSIITKKYNVDSRTLGGTYYGSTQLLHGQSGVALRISCNDVHRGGSYGGSTAYLIQLQVGGALDSTIHAAILLAASTILSKYSYSVNTEKSGVKGSSLRTSDGTNWSSVYLTAPTGEGNTYYTIPELNKI